MRRPAAATALVVSALALAVPGAASAGSVHLEQFVSTGGTVQVSVVVRKAASFSVLPAHADGRPDAALPDRQAAPRRAVPLLDTATTACDGAAGSYYCKGSFEPLPPGTYTFRVARPSGLRHAHRAHGELVAAARSHSRRRANGP